MGNRLVFRDAGYRCRNRGKWRVSAVTIKLRCKGRHEVFDSRQESETANVWKWAVRCVRGEDGKFHAFASMDDYREFKKLSPTNYR